MVIRIHWPKRRSLHGTKGIDAESEMRISRQQRSEVMECVRGEDIVTQDDSREVKRGTRRQHRLKDLGVVSRPVRELDEERRWLVRRIDKRGLCPGNAVESFQFQGTQRVHRGDGD